MSLASGLRLRAGRRTPTRLPWPPLLAAGLGAVGVVGLSLARGGAGSAMLATQVGQLALAAGAAYLLDDRAAGVTGVVPRALWRRRCAVVVPGVGVMAVFWSLLVVMVERRVPEVPTASLTVETAALTLLALASSALVARHGEDEPGSVVGPAMALFGVAGLLLQPMLGWRLFVGPADGLDPRLGAWALAGALGLVGLAAAWRDPAAATVGRGPFGSRLR